MRLFETTTHNKNGERRKKIGTGKGSWNTPICITCLARNPLGRRKGQKKVTLPLKTAYDLSRPMQRAGLIYGKGQRYKGEREKLSGQTQKLFHLTYRELVGTGREPIKNQQREGNCSQEEKDSFVGNKWVGGRT